MASLHSEGETMPSLRNKASSLDVVGAVPADREGDGMLAVAAMLLLKPGFEAPIAFALPTVAVQDETGRMCGARAQLLTLS